MTFASAILGYGSKGDKATSYGTFTNAGGDTGGNIDTGLNVCTQIRFQHSGSAVTADSPAVNATFDAGGVAGNSVAVVTTDGADGYWEAEGYQ